MFELAFNVNGERFEVPSAAEFWRPRRVRDRGLEVVYKKDGIVPLMLPITASADEFRTQIGNAPGKYRLDALDGAFQPIEGLPAAYVFVPRCDSAHGDQPVTVAPQVEVAPRGGGMSETATLLSQVVQVNAEMARTMAERFSSVMEAAAEMLRAGAGLSVRVLAEPRNGAPTPSDSPEPEGDDKDADDGGNQEGDDMLDKIDRVTRNVANTAEALSPLAMMLFSKAGLRNAGKKKEATGVTRPEPDNRPAAHAPHGEAPERADDAEPIAPTQEQMAHLMKVRARLDADEVDFITEVYGELTPSEVNRWIAALAEMSVDDAVEHIRAQIRGSATSAEVAS